MMTNKQIRFLRSKAHHLKPVVMLGNAGLTEGVMNEINLALDHHELIKVRMSGVDRDSQNQLAEQICEQTNATQVQIIGHILILYRPAKKPLIQIPKD